MRLPLSWLKEYTNPNVSAVAFSNGITESGSHIDSIETTGKATKGIVAGRVLKLEPHPNADRLVIVRVDVGRSEPVRIVTGAKNVVEGAVVPVALSGAELADGTRIQNTDFRGVESEGMLCSLEELGFDDNVIPKAYQDGIFLSESGVPGEAFDALLESMEPVLEVEVTPNRPDCLSIIGLAREAAATFGSELVIPSGRAQRPEGNIEEYLKEIRIESTACSRYMGCVIRDVKIEPSPLWMQRRLMQAGMRPINNIVDITNYVMLERGYPLHAFDADAIGGRTIVVRKASPNETLTLLNGAERELAAEDLVIADAEKPIALAGVMGGLDSEITEQTKNILIECAAFDADTVRRTAKRLNTRSEASSRFEKGIAPQGIEEVMHRVCELAETIGVGTIVNGSIDVYPNPSEPVHIEANAVRINSLLGTELTVEAMAGYLRRFFFEVETEGDTLRVTVPYFREDVRMEADLAEEIGRLFGFSNIVPTPVSGVVTEGGKTPMRTLEDKTRRILCGMGFSEALTYSFMSEKAYEAMDIPAEDPLRQFVRLINPLGEDYSVMRTTLLPNMLNVLETNSRNGQESIKMFELGNVFTPTEELLPQERRALSFGMYGRRTDFYTMKSAIFSLLARLGIRNVTVEPVTDIPYLHPGRSATLLIDGIPRGVLGEVSFPVAERIESKYRLYIAEIEFEPLLTLATDERVYKPIARFPAMQWDLALVVDKDLPAQAVQDVLESVDNPIVQNIELFDVYTGPQVPDTKKSLAYKITYQDPTQTLREEDASAAHSQLLAAAEEQVQATLRN